MKKLNTALMTGLVSSCFAMTSVVQKADASVCHFTGAYFGDQLGISRLTTKMRTFPINPINSVSADASVGGMGFLGGLNVGYLKLFGRVSVSVCLRPMIGMEIIPPLH